MPARVAVIGAGIAGLNAAARIHASGRAAVTVFESGRGPGGRASTKRYDRSSSASRGNKSGSSSSSSSTPGGGGGMITWDHGAIHINPRTDDFRDLLTRTAASQAGIVQPWQPRVKEPDGRVHVVGAAQESGQAPSSCWFVGTPGMNALTGLYAAAHGVDLDGMRTRYLASVAQINPSATMSADGKTAHQYALRGRRGEDLGSFDRVVITGASTQVTKLIRDSRGSSSSSSLQVPDELQTPRFYPIYALLVAYGRRIDPGWDLWNRAPSADVALICRNTSKPDRDPGATTAFVMHLSASATRRHQHQHKHEMVPRLLEYWHAAMPELASERRVACLPHRWGRARCTPATVLVDQPFVTVDVQRDTGPGTTGDSRPTVVAAGDFCVGDDVEGAYRSGVAAGDAIVSSLTA